MSNTTQLSCPSCGYAYTKATSTNKARNSGDVRRKRECLKCSVGFVTYEVIAKDYALLQSFRKWLDASKGDGASDRALALSDAVAVVTGDGDDAPVV